MPKFLKNELLDADSVRRRIARQKDMDKLGDLVRWGLDSIKIRPDDLRELLKQRGIEEYMPVDIKDKKAVRKAIISVKNDLQSGVLKIMSRKMWDTDVEVRYALVTEEVNEIAEEMDYSTMNQVIFHKADGTKAGISFSKAGTDEERMILEKFDYYKSVYTEEEVRKVLVNVLDKCGGITMKDGSGFWFIPAAYKDKVDALRDLINNDIDKKYGQAYFRSFALLNDETTKDGVASVFQMDIAAELDEAQKSLTTLLSAEKPTQLQLRAAAERYQTAEMKALMYQSMLQINTEEIEEVIQAGKEALSEIMMS
jgi:hypothetical protein